MKLSELEKLYNLPLFTLIDRSRTIFTENWGDHIKQKNKTDSHYNKIQLCSLLSIKTGGCSEDCAYCSQSARYPSQEKSAPLLDLETVKREALQAKNAGAERFCMGAAWRGVKRGGKRFRRVLEITRAVADLDMEVCLTLGELGEEEAKELKAAGATAYNHNIDTSPEHYPNIVSTHTFEDRLRTIKNVQKAGIKVCCGGILGLGESPKDRLRMLEVISEFDPQPESVPINLLMPMPGTPLAQASPPDALELCRVIAIARIALPKSKVRLSAGRVRLSPEAQSLCFYAGANSIFFGEKLLTAQNPNFDDDKELLRRLGLLEDKEINSVKINAKQKLARKVPQKAEA